jgi:predicted kinase
MRELFVVVSGAPGSGKSSIAPPLARALDLPLLTKDTIKEALGDVLPAPDLNASKELGAATMEVLIALACDNVGAVVESTWHREFALAQLARLRGPIVEVYCDVPPEVAQERYAARAGTRHPVHFDREQLGEDGNLAGWLARHPQFVGGDWPLIKVDTTREVDIEALAQQILDS